MWTCPAGSVWENAFEKVLVDFRGSSGSEYACMRDFRAQHRCVHAAKPQIKQGGQLLAAAVAQPRRAHAAKPQAKQTG
eukprot:215270-Chlamydomonas_euryale.AAC.2